MSKVVAATPARCDQDHVPLIVHNVPQIPDRSIAIERGSDEPFLPMLSAIRMLERSGAEYIVMPCNTAHFWYERLSLSSRAPIIHIVDAVAAAVAGDGKETLALMATRGTIMAGIYQDKLSAAGLRWLVPNEATQSLVDRAIHGVKGGDPDSAWQAADEAAARLLSQGATRLVLACTELPIAMAGSRLRDRIVDTTEVLARASVAASLGCEHAGPFPPSESEGDRHVPFGERPSRSDGTSERSAPDSEDRSISSSLG
jgi:aspartate racemase